MSIDQLTKEQLFAGCVRLGTQLRKLEAKLEDPADRAACRAALDETPAVSWDCMRGLVLRDLADRLLIEAENYGPPETSAVAAVAHVFANNLRESAELLLKGPTTH